MIKYKTNLYQKNQPSRVVILKRLIKNILISSENNQEKKKSDTHKHIRMKRGT